MAKAKESDFVKSDMMTAMKVGAGVTVIGGGAQLAGGMAILYQDSHDTGWNPDLLIYILLFGGAIIMGITLAALIGLDAVLRNKMALRALQLKGTTDASKINDDAYASVIKDLMKDGYITLIPTQRQQEVNGQTAATE